MPIRIRSKINGFRRCGVTHLSEWITHPDGKFTPEQIEILKAEPMLQVVEGDCNPPSIVGDEELYITIERTVLTELEGKVQHLADRLSEVELQRDSLQDEVNILSTDKRHLEAEVESLSARLEESVKPGRNKSK